MPVEDYDWKYLVDAPKEEVLREMAVTHSELANLHEEIAFNKVTELTNPSMKAQRIHDEGHRDALIEKKWLLYRLLEHASE